MSTTFKQLELQTDDLVTIVGAMCNLWVNNPDIANTIRIGLTEAQNEICGLQEWKWLKSTCNFVYSANQSTVNMVSVSAGKYRDFGWFIAAKVGSQYDLYEADDVKLNALRKDYSTDARPYYYWRFGDRRIAWWPKPTYQDSVNAIYRKQPGFIYGNGDIIIPQEYHLNVLARLARMKVWELRSDARAQQPDQTYQRGLAAMVRAEGPAIRRGDIRPWIPRQRRFEPLERYSGFYSTGNMP